MLKEVIFSGVFKICLVHVRMNILITSLRLLSHFNNLLHHVFLVSTCSLEYSQCGEELHVGQVMLLCYELQDEGFSFII